MASRVRIRGITSDGEVYEHPTALDLTRKFIRKFLNKTTVQLTLLHGCG